MSEPEYMRRKDAARFLSISERFLWTLSERGEIPVVKMGSPKRPVCVYSKEVLRQWMQERMIARQAQLNEGAETCGD